MEFFRSYLGYDELARKMWLCAFEAKRSASAAVKAFTELRGQSRGRQVALDFLYRTLTPVLLGSKRKNL